MTALDVVCGLALGALLLSGVVCVLNGLAGAGLALLGVALIVVVVDDTIHTTSDGDDDGPQLVIDFTGADRDN